MNTGFAKLRGDELERSTGSACLANDDLHQATSSGSQTSDSQPERTRDRRPHPELAAAILRREVAAPVRVEKDPRQRILRSRLVRG